jgi:YHS domain-containing protein
MMADEMRLFESVLGRPSIDTPAAMIGLTGEVRDPVSGRAVDRKEALTAEYADRVFYFISAESRAQFLEDPERFLRGHPTNDVESAGA